MFVAVLPPEEVRDELGRFLEPRPGLTWTDPAQWHLTLAFCPDVDEWRIDEFVERLTAAARRHERHNRYTRAFLRELRKNPAKMAGLLELWMCV